jgi:hypothetical protein
MKLKLKGRQFGTTEEIQAESECLTLWQKKASRKRSKNGGDGGTGVYMREGTTSRVMESDKPYDEFYDFYRVSSEYFGHTFVVYLKPKILNLCHWVKSKLNTLTTLV